MIGRTYRPRDEVFEREEVTLDQPRGLVAEALPSGARSIEYAAPRIEARSTTLAA